jgi:hypothetical protein
MVPLILNTQVTDKSKSDLREFPLLTFEYRFIRFAFDFEAK